MQTWLYTLGTDASIEDIRIGQKAARLNQLMLAGFPVPPGICITTAAFHAAIAPIVDRVEALKAGRNLRDPAIAQAVAQDIATVLHGMQLPAQLQRELSNQLPSLGNHMMAVRSSAALEDLPYASCAGQYVTILGVRREQEVANAILDCWRSFFSAHALTAQARYGDTSQDSIGMAVLIQTLIDAECSGVTFTVDPVRLRADTLMVTAAWGLGVGVVEGTVPTDTMRIRRSELGLEEALIADKHTAIARSRRER